MIAQGLEGAPADWSDEMKNVASVTAQAAIQARESFGGEKLSALHGALSFVRCVSGKPGKAGAAYVAWICPRCKHMSARDLAWWQCEGNFEGSRWFCSHCGLQYIYAVNGFLFGIQMTDDPLSVVWYAAEPPEGLHSNYLDYMKFGTAIFNGNFSHDEYMKAVDLKAILWLLRKMIEVDNGVFRFALVDPRIVIRRKRIVAPIPPPGTGNKKFFVKEHQLTLDGDAVGRWETFFDFSGLPIWGAESARKIVQSEWGPLINV